MSEVIKNDQAGAPEVTAAHVDAQDAQIETKVESVQPQAAIKSTDVKSASQSSFMDAVKAMSVCVVKRAPGVLKTSLTMAGKGAAALSKALHKMSDMVPENTCTAKSDQKTSTSSDDVTDNSV